MSDSLQPHGLQHARPPCPSPTPRAYSNSCPLSRWCHPTISSSVILFSSYLQSFPASKSFQMSQFFTTMLVCIPNLCQFSSVQSLSRVRLFATPWIAARQASLSITNSRSSLRRTSIESVMPSSHLILSSPLLPSSIFPSIKVFSSESALHIRWPKYWSFSFNISPFNEYSGLISFRMDWLDLLAVQGTLKSLLQHCSSKASILRHSAFFIVQLSHPYMTAGKTKALPRQTFVGKVMSLLFNMLSRLVIAFLPRSKRLLISWLQSPSAVILEPPKVNQLFIYIYIHHFLDFLPVYKALSRIRCSVYRF